MIDSKRVYKVRKSTGLTQGKFAKSIGASQTTYLRFEKDGGNISAHFIAKMIQVYGVDPDWLFFGTGGDDKVLFMKDRVVSQPVESVLPANEFAFSRFEFLEIHRGLLAASTELKLAYKELAEERKCRLELENKLNKLLQKGRPA